MAVVVAIIIMLIITIIIVIIIVRVKWLLLEGTEAVACSPSIMLYHHE